MGKSSESWSNFNGIPKFLTPAPMFNLIDSDFGLIMYNNPISAAAVDLLPAVAPKSMDMNFAAIPMDSASTMSLWKATPRLMSEKLFAPVLVPEAKTSSKGTDKNEKV